MSSRQYTAFTFTSYADTISIATVIDGAVIVDYYVYQREVCPTTNRQHWQGYVLLKLEHKTTIGRIKSKILNDQTAHIEQARGTPEQNKAYCTKTDTRLAGTASVEWGSFEHRGAGRRNDLKPFDKACQDIMSGKTTINELAATDPALVARHFRNLKELQSLALYNVYGVLTRNVSVHIVWGPTRSGKTTYIELDQFERLKRGPEDLYTVKCPGNHTLWWQNYIGQKTVIIEDFDGSWGGKLSIGQLLPLCEGRPYFIEQKGGGAYLAADEIWFTSNGDPHKDWFPKMTTEQDSERQAAFWARVTTIRHIGRERDLPAPQATTLTPIITTREMQKANIAKLKAREKAAREAIAKRGPYCMQLQTVMPRRSTDRSSQPREAPELASAGTDPESASALERSFIEQLDNEIDNVAREIIEVLSQPEDVPDG